MKTILYVCIDKDQKIIYQNVHNALTAGIMRLVFFLLTAFPILYIYF